MNKQAFLLIALFFITSCSPSTSISPDQIAVEIEKSTPNAVSIPTEVAIPTAALDPNYGIVITTEGCTDGHSTFLTLKTELNANYWQLNEENFYPNGSSYFETGIVFMENGQMFSQSSSGYRADPVFDSQSQKVSVLQTFVFLKTPLPDSDLSLEAEVTLVDLPLSYLPSFAVDFIEPGLIKIPKRYQMPVGLVPCK